MKTKVTVVRGFRDADHVGFAGDVGFFGAFIFEHLSGGFVHVSLPAALGVTLDFVWLNGDGRSDVEPVVCGAEEGFDLHAAVAGEAALLKPY